MCFFFWEERTAQRAPFNGKLPRLYHGGSEGRGRRVDPSTVGASRGLYLHSLRYP